MSAVGLFDLSADMIKLKCPCGKSEMQVIRRRESLPDGTSGGTVRLTVPCLLCPKPHTFTLRDEVFFSEDLFVLPCPYSDVNICFTGDLDHVKAELARTELELLDMLDENGLSDFSSLHGDDQALGDPQVREVVLYVIRELEAEGQLFCRCPDRQPGSTAPEELSDEELGGAVADSRCEVEIGTDGIRVTCRECGASALIPADSLVSAHDFLTVDRLVLE